MRALCAFLFLALLGTFAPVRPTRPDPLPQSSLVRFEPLPMPREEPDARLRYLAGWELDSNDPRFGGISAMHIDRGRLRAVSDAGWMIDFALASEGGDRPARITGLPGRLGGTGKKKDRDVESLAVHGGTLWLALERRNAIWRFDGPDWRQDAAVSPAGMRRWSENAGAEAMVRLADGRFLVFAEGRGAASEAVLFLGDPASAATGAVTLRYRPPAGYRVTDAALLPDGRILLLHRRFKTFEGVSAKLVVVRAPEARDGATIFGEEIATLAAPHPVDNMEALSITRESGRTIVWIASDDNYMPLQRTLLMKFALAE